MRARGLTLAELLVIMAVLLTFAAIVVPIYLHVSRHNEEKLDVQRMRSIYVAMSLYESENNERPPKNLLVLRQRLASDSDLLSSHDPWATSQGPSFPLDAELPSLERVSPVRMSFAFLPDFLRNRPNGLPAWEAAKLNPLIGVLTSGWSGKVVRGQSPFSAQVTGPVLRIQMDGSLYRLADRGGSGEMGDGVTLFIKR